MQVDVELEPRPDAPRQARQALDELEGSVSEPLLGDLRLVVSELVTNSLMHGPGGPIRVRLTVHAEDLVTGEVTDEGDGHVAIRESAADESGGWGLRILDRVASSWGVFPGSTHVWFELRER